MTLDDRLKSIGQETFLKYFDIFKNNMSDPQTVIQAFNNENWSVESKKTKAYQGISIFKNNLEMDALEAIINKDNGLSKIAEEIYIAYTTKCIKPTTEIDTKEDVINSLIAKLNNEGFNNDDIIESLVTLYNSQELDNKAIYSSKNGKISLDFCPSIDAQIIVTSEEEEKTLDIQKYQISSVCNDSSYTKKEIANKMKSRFRTQNRIYPNGFAYVPSIYGKLKGLKFKENIEKQYQKTFTYIDRGQGNYDRIPISTLDKISIRDGKLFGEMNGRDYELFFPYKNKFYSFKGFIASISDVSLGHEKSVYNIINDNKDKLKRIKEISDIIGDLFKESSPTILKHKVNSDEVIDKIREKWGSDYDQNIEELKAELDLLDDEFSCILIPLRINIAMGKN